MAEFNGVIDEVSIWSVALRRAVSALRCSGACAETRRGGRLVGLQWKRGQVAHDRSAFGNHELWENSTEADSADPSWVLPRGSRAQHLRLTFALPSNSRFRERRVESGNDFLRCPRLRTWTDTTCRPGAVSWEPMATVLTPGERRRSLRSHVPCVFFSDAPTTGGPVTIIPGRSIGGIEI